MKIRIQETSWRRCDGKTHGPVHVFDPNSSADALLAMRVIADTLDADAHGCGWDCFVAHKCDDDNVREDLDLSDDYEYETDDDTVEGVMGMFDCYPDPWAGSPTRWDGHNHSECPLWRWACENNLLADEENESNTAVFDNDCAYPTVSANDGWEMVAHWGDGCPSEILINHPDGVEITDDELVADDDDAVAVAWIAALGALDTYDLDLAQCDGYHALFARIENVSCAQELLDAQEAAALESDG